MRIRNTLTKLLAMRCWYFVRTVESVTSFITVVSSIRVSQLCAAHDMVWLIPSDKIFKVRYLVQQGLQKLWPHSSPDISDECGVVRHIYNLFSKLKLQVCLMSWKTSLAISIRGSWRRYHSFGKWAHNVMCFSKQLLLIVQVMCIVAVKPLHKFFLVPTEMVQ